jgi:hypothetical protein
LRRVLRSLQLRIMAALILAFVVALIRSPFFGITRRSVP